MQRYWSSTARLALALLVLSTLCRADNFYFSTGSATFTFGGGTFLSLSASGDNGSLTVDAATVVNSAEVDPSNAFFVLPYGCDNEFALSCDGVEGTLQYNGVTYPYSGLFVGFSGGPFVSPSGFGPFTNIIQGSLSVSGQFCTDITDSFPFPLLANCIPFNAVFPTAVGVADLTSSGLPGLPPLYSRQEIDLTFSPEPATFTMVFAGLGMCGVHRRRRGTSVLGLFMRRLSHFGTS